jgi:diguanylate cyclase (GGDEF)-like protein
MLLDALFVVLSLQRTLPIIVIGVSVKAVKKTRERSARRDGQSAAAAEELPNHLTLDEVLSSAVALACDILRSDAAGIALVDEKGDLALRIQHGLSPQFASWPLKRDRGIAGIVFQIGEAWACADLLADTQHRRRPVVREGMRALLAVPLRLEGEVAGCLYIGKRSVHEFLPEEIRLASHFAEHVSMSIESTALLRHERQQRQVSETLLEIVTAPSIGASVRTVLVGLCQSVLKLTVGERCSILLFDEDTHTLGPTLSLGVEDQDLWEKFRASAGREIPEIRGVGEAINAREPVIEEHAPGSGVIPAFWIKTFGIKSLTLYPLVHREKTVGIMVVDSYSKFVHFPEAEVEILAGIARQAAIIIENARLYEQEQLQRKRAETLVAVLTAAAEDTSLRKVLANICRAVVDLTVGDRSSIFIVGKDGRTLQPMMSMGIEDPEMWQKFRNAAPSARRSEEAQESYQDIATWDKPVVAEDALNTVGVNRWWVENFKIKSLVRYPLRLRDKTIGMMVVDTVHEYKRFPQEEIETIGAIAKQAAIIIENARLHERLQEQAITDSLTGLHNYRHIHERLEEEFERASRGSQPFAVLMMDLDNFKFFNDLHGHQTGDEALKFAAEQIKKSLRAVDIVGRYGGDEFLAVLPQTNRAEAEQAADRIISTLADTPFHIPGSIEEVPIDVSIGVGCYPYDSSTKHDLVAVADTAMYEAKRAGGACAVPAYACSSQPISSQSVGFGLLHSLMNALAHKDPYTKRHCEDNVRYIDRLAECLQLPPAAQDSLKKAALLHDVGKIAVPDSTLLKPGPLNAQEWEVMRQHVEFGETIVRGISQIADAIEPVATHHERYDGMGYPRGLKGEDIPLLGRILAVVDAYSAMTLDRPYRKALTHAQAVEELKKGAGTQFDPRIVDAFLSVIDDIRQARAA